MGPQTNTHGNPNGARFVTAYNQIDGILRSIYGFRANITFTDLIRRCAGLNSIIRVYEDDLVDLARLRNAIIHNKSETLIAEPNLEVVELMEKVAALISTPPIAIEVIKSVNVAVAHSDISLKDLLLETSRYQHNNFPIYKRNTFIGVFNSRLLAKVLADIVTEGKSIDSYIRDTTVEEFMRNNPNKHFALASEHVTIEEVLTLFNESRKLSCVLITKDGGVEGRPLGIITNSDLMDLKMVMNKY